QALAWGVPAAVMLWCLYRFGLRWRSPAMGALGSALACVLIAWPPAHWVVAAAWLALLSLAYDAVMRLCHERFPMTRFSGWVLWLGVLGTMLVSAAMLPLRDVPGMEAEQGLRIFTFGALRALEFVLAATVLWWGAAGLALFVWLIAGLACSRTHGFEGRATVATGRLGLFSSISFFVVMAMAAWAALTPLLDLSVAGMHYLPLIFREGGCRLAGGVVCGLSRRALRQQHRDLLADRAAARRDGVLPDARLPAQRAGRGPAAARRRHAAGPL